MSKKVFKKEDIEIAANDEAEENFPLVLKYAGDWISDGKYENQENIFTDTSTGKFYRYYYSRTGSYFTDYYYNIEDEKDEIELDEVILVTKVIKVWRRA